MTQITVENVSLGYDGKAVVRDLSFSIQKGDYLCIVGENGSGKSTLIKALLKMHNPLSGNIVISDEISSKSIGYLPQQTQAQRDFPASVLEVVLSGCISRIGLFPIYTKKEKRRALANMDKLGIANLAHCCYRELSGGQQQRVLLARALCAAEEMLLLDEPVAGLDPGATAELYSLIKKLNREDGITIIMVSHDVESVTEYASHILHISSEHHFFGSAVSYRSKIQTEKGGAE